MTVAGTKPVVVGIDGSSSAVDAARWAAVEAQRRRTWLQVVFCDAFALAYLPDLPTMPLPETYANAMTRQAHLWLHRARVEASEAVPEVEVRTFVRTGGAIPVLVDESRSAQLVVVGSRGLGGFTGLVVGSVAVGLCAHGHCSVAVVRQPPTTAADAPVVVGVADPAPEDTVLQAAFEEAVTRSAPLEAVHAWYAVGTEEAWYSFHSEGRAAAVQQEEERILAETLASWSEKYPGVEVRRIVARGKPARVLLDHAQHAQLVVVGSRGRGSLAGLLLGSTSQQLVHHAPCPFIVAR
ncbi:universal stress protein [Saccharopolyspora sp. K220]|uniref:universal stress protein n=1 Tax=Saccharopolyspora soli TaxID=2926618 RepID=UPI001F5A7C34|nr:universal stress protein [Saccharopolyspora soli]MCI2422422.1 universal stress protein [Saccharopolyspora soli]